MVGKEEDTLQLKNCDFINPKLHLRIEKGKQWHEVKLRLHQRI
jgi:hypothetical protein